MTQAHASKPAETRPEPKTIHIFKPGRFTTVRGETIEFSEADLAATASAYDARLHRSPLVVGHPQLDDPAHGWVTGLSANARGLFARADHINPAFAECVRAQRYGAVSAKFYRPTDPNNPKPGVWYLQHVGFLGAKAPAVKGLDAPEFAQADGDTGVIFQQPVEFGDWEDVTNARLWRRLRDWFIGKFGADEADKVLPQWDVSAMETAAAQELVQEQSEASNPQDSPATGSSPAFSEPHPRKEATVTEQEAAQLRTQMQTLTQQNAALTAQVQQQQRAQVHAGHVAFAEGLVAQGRMLPAFKDVAVATLNHLSLPGAPTADGAAGAAVEFGEGDAKKPLAQAFEELLKALPVQVAFGEHATQQRAAGAGGAAPAGTDPVEFAQADPERLAQHRLIQAHMDQHKTDYATAARAVIK